MNLTVRPSHWAVLAAFAITLGAQLQGVPDGWHTVNTPAFIGTLALQVGTLVGALYTHSIKTAGPAPTPSA